MAYNSGYNPDALPAHAEPEQAAQILSQQQQAPPQQQRPVPPQGRRTSATRPQGDPAPYSQFPPNYQNKPPQAAPPAGSQWPPQQGYAPRPPPSTSPHNYSHSPPAPPQNGFRPPRPPGPPVTPAPPRAASQSSKDATLLPLFRAVDKHGTGQLSERELRNALVNGDYTSFDPHTVKMMIRMFDTDRNGTIGFDEFCGLWSFLAAWRTLFDRFDADRSGNISPSEFSDALSSFGYRLSSTFVGILYRTYDKGGNSAMSFDLFVQACIALKRMTDVFKRYDDDRDGYITLSFEEFLTEILRQR